MVFCANDKPIETATLLSPATLAETATTPSTALICDSSYASTDTRPAVMVCVPVPLMSAVMSSVMRFWTATPAPAGNARGAAAEMATEPASVSASMVWVE